MSPTRRIRRSGVRWLNRAAPAGQVWSRRWISDLDGRLLAGGCDKTMSLWDVTDPAHPAQWSALAEQGRPGWSGVVKAVDFSPDGRLVAMGATNGVVFWDITDPARPARIAFAREEDKDLGWWARVFGAQGYPTVRAVAFSPDGRLLATVGGHVRASSGNAGDTGSSSRSEEHTL